MTTHNVATVRLLQERNDEARVLLDRAEQVIEKAVGPDDPAMTMTRSAQAELALKLGEVKKARRLMAAVLPVTEKAYGKDHPNLAERLTIWGDILLREHDLSGARAAHERALAIWRQQRTDHPLVGRSLHGIASVLLAERRYAEAIEQFEQGRGLVEKGYGRQHPSVLASMTGIGRARLESGRPQAAIEILERAVALLEAEHVYLGEGDTRFELARALWAGGSPTARWPPRPRREMPTRGHPSAGRSPGSTAGCVAASGLRASPLRRRRAEAARGQHAAPAPVQRLRRLHRLRTGSARVSSGLQQALVDRIMALTAGHFLKYRNQDRAGFYGLLRHPAQGPGRIAAPVPLQRERVPQLRRGPAPAAPGPG